MGTFTFLTSQSQRPGLNMKPFAFLLLALIAAVTAIPAGSSGDFDYTMERFGYGYTMELQGSGDYSSDNSYDYSGGSSGDFSGDYDDGFLGSGEIDTAAGPEIVDCPTQI